MSPIELQHFKQKTKPPAHSRWGFLIQSLLRGLRGYLRVLLGKLLPAPACFVRALEPVRGEQVVWRAGWAGFGIASGVRPGLLQLDVVLGKFAVA